MAFIEAGINYPQENKFRGLVPKSISKILNSVGKSVKSACGWNSSNYSGTSQKTQGSGFKSGIPVSGYTPSFPKSNNTSNDLGLIKIKQIDKADIGPSIDISKLLITGKKIRNFIRGENKNTSIQKNHETDMQFKIPYQTMYYNNNGKGYQVIPKGTQITYSSDDIRSIYDSKTGKYQTYARVESFTKVNDSTRKNHDMIPDGYIRTPWFDGVVNRENSNSTKNPEKKSPTISFSGYIGPDGKEIPETILREETVTYFGKKIVPKVVTKIQDTNEKISTARKIMTQEYLKYKIPLQQTSAYTIQLKQIEEKGKMEKLHESLTKFTIHNGSIYDANTVKLIQSIQNTPEWELIKQKAAFRYRQIRLGKK